MRHIAASGLWVILAAKARHLPTCYLLLAAKALPYLLILLATECAFAAYYLLTCYLLLAAKARYAAGEAWP